MKTLNLIQRIVYIIRIVTLVVAICAFVGAAIMLISGAIMLAVPTLVDIELFNELLIESGAPGATQLAATLFAETIIVVGQAVVLLFAYDYFGRELKDGTPFTLRGAKELMIVGILTAAVPFGTSAIASMMTSIAGISNGITISSDISLGLALVFVSLILRYGAELNEARQNTSDEENKNE